MVLPHTDALGATMVAEMARAAVEALAIPHATHPLQKVTVSVGVASRTFDNAIQEVQALVRHADEALYEAKAAGRNRVVVHRDQAIYPRLIAA